MPALYSLETPWTRRVELGGLPLIHPTTSQAWKAPGLTSYLFQPRPPICTPSSPFPFPSPQPVSAASSFRTSQTSVLCASLGEMCKETPLTGLLLPTAMSGFLFLLGPHISVSHLSSPLFFHSPPQTDILNSHCRTC